MKFWQNFSTYSFNGAFSTASDYKISICPKLHRH